MGPVVTTTIKTSAPPEVLAPIHLGLRQQKRRDLGRASHYSDSLLDLHRLPSTHGRRSIQLVPGEMPALKRALDRLEQHHREQLPICEALQPHVTQQPHVALATGAAVRSSAKAMADAMKSITRKIAKNSTSCWKLAGSAVSGWK